MALAHAVPSPGDAAVLQALHMTFGVDTVTLWGRNVSVNGVVVPEGQPYLHGGECSTGSELPPTPGPWVPAPVPSLVPC